ncbi:MULTISPECIES: cell division protein FtsX [Flavobacteriaceae]|uniref:Cell division protein FtsX n=2 Tax=Flavobacteriaceae TaxID=49546 RepID=A0A4Y8ATQ6_9FLAO|nr:MULTISPECIES: permease-like cell division protein FtsX [Flavobacteriaceae]TEW74863.1 FtsX-like permease family protein [Gramella jeungdoensis]GGK43391.1 cell division protein FtsX [Lutibacter litoralis]
MNNSFDKYQKRRLRSSYLSVIISIALVLFLVGFLGVILLKTNTISNHFKEKVAITIFLNDNAKSNDVEILEAELKQAEYSKEVVYISKKEAAEIYAEEIGEDFVEFLGDNPLKNAIDVTLKSDFVTPEQMGEIEKNLLIRSIVAEVVYDKPLIELLTKNINRISFWMLLLSALFTLIAVVLINSSIRISIYSKRFTIKTMQMVGATKGFIRRPFIWKSIKLGIIGALVSNAALVGFIIYINKMVPEIELLSDYKALGFLFLFIIIMGILITWLSTFFATQRFLNLRTDELYY